MLITITEDDRTDISFSRSEGGATKNRGLALSQTAWYGKKLLLRLLLRIVHRLAHIHRVVVRSVRRRRRRRETGHGVRRDEALGGLVVFLRGLLLRFGGREVEDHAVAFVRDHAGWCGVFLLGWCCLLLLALCTLGWLVM